jgi:hypothetical protein
VFCISGKRRQAWVWHLQKEIPKLGMVIRHHRWWGQIQKHLDFTTLPLGQEPNCTSSFFFVCFLFFSWDSLFSLVRGWALCKAVWVSLSVSF